VLERNDCAVAVLLQHIEGVRLVPHVPVVVHTTGLGRHAAPHALYQPETANDFRSTDPMSVHLA
jgi:hypothetical protein